MGVMVKIEVVIDGDQVPGVRDLFIEAGATGYAGVSGVSGFGHHGQSRQTGPSSHPQRDGGRPGREGVAAARTGVRHEGHHGGAVRRARDRATHPDARVQRRRTCLGQVNLGITLISRDAVTRELSEGALEEWRREGLLRQRAWHLVGRAGEDLPATA